jgi:hypothetical protein
MHSMMPQAGSTANAEPERGEAAHQAAGHERHAGDLDQRRRTADPPGENLHRTDEERAEAALRRLAPELRTRPGALDHRRELQHGQHADHREDQRHA